jgi:D-beta-D-heptose 7-phosphate kinase / D-beta-D-heptose 1-phosphate adenosyltransferase
MNIDAITKNKILVVGDIILDEYLGGSIDRISPEAPVPVVHVKETSYRLGGAANVASNLKALGCEVILLGIIGDDYIGNKIANILAAENIEVRLVKSKKPSIRKTRIIGRSSHILRLDYEEHYSESDASELEANFNSVIKSVDSCIFSDYSKGTLQNVTQLIKIAKKASKLVFTDPKHASFSMYAGSDFITPNSKEMANMLPVSYDSSEWLPTLKSKMLQHKIANVLYTRGKDGMSLITKSDKMLCVNAIASEVFDVTGAGDTVIAIFAALITANFDYKKAMTVANYAAGFVVKRQGTAQVGLSDLLHLLQVNMGDDAVSNAIIADVKSAKAEGYKVVMTNGCFDILHAGHVYFLEQAKMQGDKLIVAVNSDASVRKLKGTSRPINTIANRITVLRALSCVDWVVVFDEQTPKNIITAISPDVLVKGSDYKVSEIVGADHVQSYGGIVNTVDLVPDLSTSNVLKKIENNTQETELV